MVTRTSTSIATTNPSERHQPSKPATMGKGAYPRVLTGSGAFSLTLIATTASWLMTTHHFNFHQKHWLFASSKHRWVNNIPLLRPNGAKGGDQRTSKSVQTFAIENGWKWRECLKIRQCLQNPNCNVNNMLSMIQVHQPVDIIQEIHLLFVDSLALAVSCYADAWGRPARICWNALQGEEGLWPDQLWIVAYRKTKHFDTIDHCFRV